jgi:hypothetical protein
MKEAQRLTEQGVVAAKAGRKEEAAELLSQALALDPRNERAWLWLSTAVDTIEEQRECLQRVLAINPSNPFARGGLAFLSHLRTGYEYLAARAPWMAGVEDTRPAIADLPARHCPRCGAVNPGWAYLCNGCSAVLEPVDVAELAKREMRKGQRSPSLVRPWASAAVLDAERAFAPEVALASPFRAVLVVAMGTLALNLLRVAGTLGVVAFSTGRQPSRLLDRLATAFLADQAVLLIGALAIWLLLAAVIQAIARAQGGLGSPRVTYYLVAVAVSAWMPISGVTGLLWWTAAMLIPDALVPLVAAMAAGLLFFYAVTLVVQALHTAHQLQPLPETASVGLLLTVCTALYAGLTALSPPLLQVSMLKVVEFALLPLWP